MKKLLIPISVMLLTFLSCKKEKEPDTTPSPTYWGEANFTIYGVNETAQTYATTVEPGSTIAVYVDVFDKNTLQTGRLSLGNIPKHTGIVQINQEKYPGDGLPYAVFSEKGSDYIVGRYTLLENAGTNAVEITAYEENKGEVSGKFNLTFVVDSTFKLSYPSLADTLEIKDGYFHTKIYKY